MSDTTPAARAAHLYGWCAPAGAIREPMDTGREHGPLTYLAAVAEETRAVEASGYNFLGAAEIAFGMVAAPPAVSGIYPTRDEIAAVREILNDRYPLR